MLDKAKLIAELQQLSHVLFADVSTSVNYAQKAWNELIHDSSFLNKVLHITNAPWPVPLWQENLADRICIDKMTHPYVVFSVDGSQIYPDRHTILSCCLINIGSVVLPYSLAGKRVFLSSEPTVFAGIDDNQMVYSVDSVDCKRQELELSAGLSLGRKIKKEYDQSTFSLLLFDGSLIFWHLSSKESHIRDYFLEKYLSLLKQLYEENIIAVWYISMPKSKELMSLVRLFLCNGDYTNKDLYAVVDAVIDSTIMQSHLTPYTRSIVFKNQSIISSYYSSSLVPHFFYIHTGNEIGRVEIPGWIAQNNVLVNNLASIILDQCIKGNGYPVALAEAHEQAVVKGPDREFFYHYVQKLGMERKHKMIISRKSLQKKGIGI